MNNDAIATLLIFARSARAADKIAQKEGADGHGEDVVTLNRYEAEQIIACIDWLRVAPTFPGLARGDFVFSTSDPLGPVSRVEDVNGTTSCASIELSTLDRETHQVRCDAKGLVKIPSKAVERWISDVGE